MKTNKKILIVDDDVDVITVAQTILTKEGYTVISASGKEEGLELLRTEKPDMAILDVMMTTHYEGFELANEMLNNPDLKNVPFLIQTSIDVLTTTKASVQDMAREFRRDSNFKDLNVLLVKNVTDGSAGIDYKTDDGTSVFFPVGGFLTKPIDGTKLVSEVNKLMKK
ncbi:MAG: response regulator [Bacteroidetes bacterium]|nr:response regulator [Bacteroidota bacterium]